MCIVSDSWTPIKFSRIWIVKVYAHSNVINIRFLVLENLLIITVPYVSNSRSYGCYTHLKLAPQTLVAQRLKRWEMLVVQQRAKGVF